MLQVPWQRHGGFAPLCTSCWNGPACKWLARGCCLFFHPHDADARAPGDARQAAPVSTALDARILAGADTLVGRLWGLVSEATLAIQKLRRQAEVIGNFMQDLPETRMVSEHGKEEPEERGEVPRGVSELLGGMGCDNREDSPSEHDEEKRFGAFPEDHTSVSELIRGLRCGRVSPSSEPEEDQFKYASSAEERVNMVMDAIEMSKEPGVGQFEVWFTDCWNRITAARACSNCPTCHTKFCSSHGGGGCDGGRQLYEMLFLRHWPSEADGELDEPGIGVQ